MKTVARLMWIHEADLIRAKLEMHGIRAFIPDEQTANTVPVWGNTMGGVRVQVADEDEARAREIIGEAPEEEGSCMACPACGSVEVSQLKRSRRMFFGSMLLFGFPLIWMKRAYVCGACGHKWKD